MEYICTLGYDPRKKEDCQPFECLTCGWEAAEVERREEHKRKHGFTLCEDGKRRLIIENKEKRLAAMVKQLQRDTAP